jgi:hypothetical protein
VSGAIAGGTGGASLLVIATVSSVGDVPGGIVTRTIGGEDTTTDDIEEDAVTGFLGGAAGHFASDVVHVPEERTLPGTRRHAVGRNKLAKYDAAVRQRNNLKMVHAGLDVGAASNVANASSRGFWSFLDWLSQPPPPPTPPGPPLNPHSTTRVTDCHDMQGVPCQ